MIERLKSRQGDGSISAIVITLVLILIFTLVMEYFRLYTIASGVREAVTGGVNVLATQNADKAYSHFREGENNMDTDAEAVQRMNSLPLLLGENLCLVPEGGSVYKKLLDNGATEYILRDFDITHTTKPLILS